MEAAKRLPGIPRCLTYIQYLVFSLSMAAPFNKASLLGYSPNMYLNAYLNAVVNTDGLNTFLNETL